MINKALMIAESLVRYHLSKEWTIRMNGRLLKTFGQCNHLTKVINLSKKLTINEIEDSVIDTILHEIAHALVGSGHGHGKVWINMALSIGCAAKRTRVAKLNSFGLTESTKYVAVYNGQVYCRYVRQPNIVSIEANGRIRGIPASKSKIKIYTVLQWMQIKK